MAPTKRKIVGKTRPDGGGGETQPEHLRNRAKPAVATRLDRDQIARVDELAATRGVTRSRFLADAIAAVLDATAPTPDHSRSSTTAA